MRSLTKVLSALIAAGLAVTMAACSDSPGGSDTSSPSGTDPVGAFKTLDGVKTTVILDPGFVEALGKLKLTATPFGDAKAKKAGKRLKAIFPITGGNATIYAKGDVDPYVQGEIDHEGSGLRFTAGDTTFVIMNFAIHPGSHATVTGDVTINDGTPLHEVVLFDLDGSTLNTPTISKAGVAKLKGTTIYLASEAAAAMNGVFGTDALAGGRKVKIGKAVIKATGT